MRLGAVTAAQRRMLGELAGRISNRLEAEFVDPSAAAAAGSVGVLLNERGKRVAIEIPEALLLQAETDAAVRDTMRLRIKAARDRMLFRPPPHHPTVQVAPAGESWVRGGRGSWGGGGGGRGRR